MTDSAKTAPRTPADERKEAGAALFQSPKYLSDARLSSDHKRTRVNVTLTHGT